MALDLILGPTSLDYSRGGSLEPISKLEVLGILTLFGAVAWRSAHQASDDARVRRSLRDKGLQRTQELPSISMKEMVYGRRD